MFNRYLTGSHFKWLSVFNLNEHVPLTLELVPILTELYFEPLNCWDKI